MTLADVLDEEFWARHTNPWSGYNRLPMVSPILLYFIVNLHLFSEPESKDAWISWSVLGEQRWLKDGHEVFEANLPGVLNGLNAVTY
jgi:hypothetical protein